MKLTPFLIAALILSLVSCDNAGSNEQRVKDSVDSVRREDSMMMNAPTMTSPPPPEVPPDSAAKQPDDLKSGDPTRRKDRKPPSLK